MQKKDKKKYFKKTINYLYIFLLCLFSLFLKYFSFSLLVSDCLSYLFGHLRSLMLVDDDVYGSYSVWLPWAVASGFSPQAPVVVLEMSYLDVIHFLLKLLST